MDRRRLHAPPVRGPAASSHGPCDAVSVFWPMRAARTGPAGWAALLRGFLQKRVWPVALSVDEGGEAHGRP